MNIDFNSLSIADLRLVTACLDNNSELCNGLPFFEATSLFRCKVNCLWYFLTDPTTQANHMVDMFCRELAISIEDNELLKLIEEKVLTEIVADLQTLAMELK